MNGAGQARGAGLGPALIVYVKECRESLRDRRVLLNALVLGPLFTPLLFLALIHLIVGREMEKAEKPLPVAVIGAEFAPNFIADLRQQGMEQRPPVADPEAAVRQQAVDLVLRIDARFAQDWEAGRPAQVEFFYDSSRQDLRSAIDRLQTMVEAYTRRTGSLRLLARGIAPALMSPVVLAGRDQATPEARGAMLLGMLPYFLILTALLGGMWLAIDATAGERERQSLEPLLINPVGRGQILLGKLLATATFSMASLMLGMLAFLVVGHMLPSDEPGLALSIGPRFILGALPILVPLVFLIAAAQIWVASFARSFREAQTYLGLAQLVPLVPSILLMAVPMRPQLWMSAIPVFGQQVTIAHMLRGEAADPLGVAIGVVVTLATAAGVFWLVLRLYAEERVAIAG
jgi:sodium transport system permease protein